jgi:hypothetical protein
MRTTHISFGNFSLLPCNPTNKILYNILSWLLADLPNGASFYFRKSTALRRLSSLQQPPPSPSPGGILNHPSTVKPPISLRYLVMRWN